MVASNGWTLRVISVDRVKLSYLWTCFFLFFFLLSPFFFWHFVLQTLFGGNLLKMHVNVLMWKWPIYFSIVFTNLSFCNISTHCCLNRRMLSRMLKYCQHLTKLTPALSGSSSGLPMWTNVMSCKISPL